MTQLTLALQSSSYLFNGTSLLVLRLLFVGIFACISGNIIERVVVEECFTDSFFLITADGFIDLFDFVADLLWQD
jgi:hypothetical protein